MIALKEKIGYGFGDMASSMFWKLFGSYLMIFYTDVFGMPAAAVGTMFLVTRAWDSAFDPVVGILADRTQSRWGKFRPCRTVRTYRHPYIYHPAVESDGQNHLCLCYLLTDDDGLFRH